MARKVKWTEAAWSDLEVVADYIYVFGGMSNHI
jgi:plasmid stabilization system protein ParE